ncbi:RNase H domain-containing protein [Trichonephila clavipes]|nr:RNase H domain-containing protein [Trichonephila clavipes]
MGPHFLLCKIRLELAVLKQFGGIGTSIDNDGSNFLLSRNDGKSFVLCVSEVSLANGRIPRGRGVTFVFSVSELLDSESDSSPIDAERFPSSTVGGGGGVVLPEPTLPEARCFFPAVPGTGETVVRLFLVLFYDFEGEGGRVQSEKRTHQCSRHICPIDYGCVAYGSACNSTLQKLDPVHHMALRICSGAFRTSPVQSLYVNCHQLPLDLRRRKLSLAFYFKILSVPSHPLQNVYMSTSMKRLYDARPKGTFSYSNLGIRHGSHYINPFATYSKSTVAPVVFQRVFAYHRSQYSRYSAIYTDGSKRADYVGCGVVIEDIMHGYRLDTSCSIFTAEAVAIYRALQLIDSTMPRKYCIYTDSMSVLEALENYHDRCHPVVCTILDITSRLYSKGFDIVFCWLPSHVGIIGNEQADSAAKSATTHLPLAVPLSDMKHVIMHHIFKIWQESWSQQLDNKLHSVKPVIGAWPVMPMRRTDVKLTRLRIGHTRFTHRHLLFGERAPECPSCHVSYTVHHILIDCPVFNTHRMTFFHQSVLTLSDLVGESPQQNLFAFIRRIGFLYLI